MQDSGFWQDDVDGCRRCGADLDGAFCSRCGQKRGARLTVRRTLGELLHHLTSVDSALLRTVVGLTRRPGEVVRRYIAGDRTGYLNPAKYTFLAATLYAFVILVFEIDVRPASVRNTDQRAIEGMRLVVGLLGYLVFVYLLPAAALLRWLFRDAPMNFAESYVALLYFAGHYLLGITLLALIGVFSLPVGFWIVRGFGFLVLLWLIADLYQRSRLRTFFSSLAVYALVMAGGLAAGMATAYIRWAIYLAR